MIGPKEISLQEDPSANAGAASVKHEVDPHDTQENRGDTTSAQTRRCICSHEADINEASRVQKVLLYLVRRHHLSWTPCIQK